MYLKLTHQMVIDATSASDYSWLLVEVLVLLRDFPRPFIILINKIDLIDQKNIEVCEDMFEIVQTERLLQEHPNVAIIPFTSFNASHVDHLKDWLKQLLGLFGNMKLAPVKDVSPKKSSAGLCC